MIEPSPKRPSRLLIAAVVFTTAAIASFSNTAAAADSRSLAFYTGLREGGSFTDVTTGKAIDIQNSASLATSLNFPLEDGRQLQIYFSYQDSHLAIRPTAINPSSLVINELPLQVMYLHLGGPVFFDDEEEDGRGAYMVGGLGVTLFDPSLSGYSSELRASANLGVGYEQPLGKRLALRIEARGYFTLVNSSGGLFCNGGCVITVSGNTVIQGELSVGLAFRL